MNIKLKSIDECIMPYLYLCTVPYLDWELPRPRLFGSPTIIIQT